jgi:hypothetical protein
MTEGPMPENAVYYHAAYIATALIYAAYAASIVWRGRSLRLTAKTSDIRSQNSEFRDDVS